jgi:hypothetical protein
MARSALESAGVQFIDKNGGGRGASYENGTRKELAARYAFGHELQNEPDLGRGDLEGAFHCGTAPSFRSAACYTIPWQQPIAFNTARPNNQNEFASRVLSDSRFGNGPNWGEASDCRIVPPSSFTPPTPMA